MSTGAETFVDEETWAQCPDEADEAFLYVHKVARAKLDGLLDGYLSPGRYTLEQWRTQYIIELASIAGQLGLASGLSSLGVYLSSEDKMDEFDLDIAQKVTVLRARNRDKIRADSVRLPIAVKAEIQERIDALRTAVAASNLSDRAKSRLFSKIDDVESELAKPRSSLRSFWILAGAVGAAFTGTVTVLADAPDAAETANIMLGVVNGEKASEEESERLLLDPPVLQLTDQTEDPQSD